MARVSQKRGRVSRKDAGKAPAIGYRSPPSGFKSGWWNAAECLEKDRFL